MAVFTYAARDSKGALVQGDIQAPSPVEAARLLKGEGKFVVKVSPKAGGKSAAPVVPSAGTSKRVSLSAPAKTAAPDVSKLGNKYRPDDLIYFTNQLAVLVETGVTLADALDACMHDGNSPGFAKALAAIYEKVQAGSEFSAALSEHPKIFSPMYVSLIKASEASGLMGPLLRRLASHLEAQREMYKKIKGAVTYPIVMFLFAIGVTIFLMTFVLPKFANIYNGREDKLPKLTRYLMAFSGWLTGYGMYIMPAIVVGLIVLIYYVLKVPAGRRLFERVKLNVPMIGPMYHKSYLTRSLRTLGTMIGAGVSMLDGVKLTSGICDSFTYEQMWNEVHERIQTGQQLSDALTDYKQVSKAVNKMLAAGERGGQLGPVMERVANFCDAELSVAIKTMTGMLEPAIIMFLGTIVGGLVLALLLPIFTISKAMR
ncbi:MAG TPA: type II secretion system F family protein [Phycisphaerae bacterium]|nr:type II secretion system F family protein [Phycisphaerae bacterium]